MEDDALNEDLAPLMVAPDTTTPRVFGILNIIFSLLAGCASIYALAMAIFLPIMAQTMEEASQKNKDSTAQQIENLQQQLQAATTEEEKEELSTQIEDLELEAEIEMPNPFLAMNNPTMNLYGIIDGSTGLLFNLIMFVTGVGLLMRKEWARKLAIWTAALKIVRLLILQSIKMVYIIPIQAKGMQEMYKQMDVGGQGQGPDMSQMASMQGGMYMAWAVVMLIGGCVYPVLSIWFLSRPGVQATCQLENIESDQVE